MRTGLSLFCFSEINFALNYKCLLWLFWAAALHYLLHTSPPFVGKDHFPAEWPDEVQQLFHTILLNGVLATVDSFDGSANVLSLTVPTERGGGHLTAMVLDALQAQTKTHSCADTTQRYDQTDSCTPSTSPTAVADCPQHTSMPEIQQRQENKTANTGLTMIPEPAPQPLEQDKKTCAVSVDGWFNFCHVCALFKKTLS